MSICAQSLLSGPSGKVTGGAGVDAATITNLVRTLEDEAARRELIAGLKALQASAGPKTQLTETKQGRSGGQMIQELSARIESVSRELVIAAGMLLDVPRFAVWITRQVSLPENRVIWIDTIWKIFALFLSALLVEWAVRRLLHRARTAVEGSERDSVILRLPFLLARTFIDVLPIAAFAAAAYLVLAFLDPAEMTRLVALALVNSSVIARAVMSLTRMIFVPRAVGLRVLTIDNENANYIVLWVRRFTNVGVYGYFLAEAVLLLGLPFSGYLALVNTIGFLIVILAIIFVLQVRQTVAGWVGGQEGGALPGLRIARRRLADLWHVLAIVYLVAVYGVWALGITGGFEFILRASALSLVILTIAKILMILSHTTVRKGFGVRPETLSRYPGLAARTNRYFAVLETAIVTVISAIAVFAILQAWGVDAFGWVRTDYGRRILGSAISSGLVIVVAVALWEVVSSVIERYLARGEDGDREVSARAKTLLPLLRKALLLVVATIVVLIVLSEIGVDIGPLLAGAGVIGLAVGFGAQTLVKDVITGVFILAEDQFAIGDIVRVNEKSGAVEEITIRTLRLRDLGGNVHIIPFSSVGMVENMTKDFSRYVFDVGIAYREDIDEVIEVLRDLGAEMQADTFYGPMINEPIEIMGVQRFDDSAVVVRARFTTKPIKQWQIGREFNRRMKRRFDELGIEIPFPHQTLYFGEEKGGGAPPVYMETSAHPDRGKRVPKSTAESAVRTDSGAADGDSE
ncbi:MAG: mechanosensitive ion channel domain-containing protein [Pseudomonadota bacterium]|nr:mechanosensitive ion channel domain-containing protein [Pseudomonadota bacterium]